MFIDIKNLIELIEYWKQILNPDSVEWYFGETKQKQKLIDKLKSIGLAKQIDSKDNSWAFFSDPSDVARMESKTFICSKSNNDCGITNNWVEPSNMYWDILLPKLKNVMKGRTMYIIPFSMGNPNTKKKYFWN